MQVPVPEQAPLHPLNAEYKSAVAVNVTKAPLVYVALHVEPQLMPAGELVTLPVPVPVRLTLNVLLTEVNVAVTLRVAFMVTLHVFPENESHPLQLVNVELPSGLAVSVTGVPLL